MITNVYKQFAVLAAFFYIQVHGRIPCLDDFRAYSFCEQEIYEIINKGHPNLCAYDYVFKYVLCCKQCEALYGGESQAQFSAEFELPHNGYCADNPNAAQLCEKMREGKPECKTYTSFIFCPQTCGYCDDFNIKAKSLNSLGALPPGLRSLYQLPDSGKNYSEFSGGGTVMPTRPTLNPDNFKTTPPTVAGNKTDEAGGASTDGKDGEAKPAGETGGDKPGEATKPAENTDAAGGNGEAKNKDGGDTAAPAAGKEGETGGENTDAAAGGDGATDAPGDPTTEEAGDAAPVRRFYFGRGAPVWYQKGR